MLQKYPFVPSPFRDTYSTARLDYNGWHSIHFFARANYEVNSAVSAFGLGYSIYANRDNTPGIAGGADFSTAHTTHSIRVSYEKFHNLIGNSVSGSNTYYGVPGIEFYYAAQGLYSGPNYLAPQQTYQSDKQFRYDGSWIKGHTTSASARASTASWVAVSLASSALRRASPSPAVPSWDPMPAIPSITGPSK